jgi:hypothetical protein
MTALHNLIAETMEHHGLIFDVVLMILEHVL